MPRKRYPKLGGRDCEACLDVRIARIEAGDHHRLHEEDAHDQAGRRQERSAHFGRDWARDAREGASGAAPYPLRRLRGKDARLSPPPFSGYGYGRASTLRSSTSAEKPIAA